MLRKATMLLGALLVLAPVMFAHAQEVPHVTVRELNAIPDENITTLNQQGTSVTEEEISSLIFNDFLGETVQFTAVVLSDPLNSGLASVRDDGNVGRIHIFVRDTSAVSQGNSGMGIQLVPGYPSYDEQGLLGLQVGDVIDVVGTVSPFPTGAPKTMQFVPQTVTVLGAYADLGLPESILDPVEIVTADANESVGNDQVQLNWDSLDALRGQRVRIENATVYRSSPNNTGRPNWAISTDGGQTYIPIYDVSLRYRNDKSDYPDDFNKRRSNDPFIPPPPGSKVNLTGFLLYNDFDFVGRSVPDGALLSIAPFTDEDLEITETPPIITPIARVTEVPGAEPVEVTVYVKPDPSRTLDEVVLNYYTSADPDTTTLTGTAVNDTTFTFSIPAAEDETFVTYWAVATDNQGAESESDDRAYRVLTEGINEIADVQLTASGGAGASPFVGVETDLNITATVASRPDESGLVTVQDDNGLAPWTGIFITGEATDTLMAGDVVHITHATIQENFDVTRLSDVTIESVQRLGIVPDYKEVTTDAMQDTDIAEAHEGMRVQFNDVRITDPDAGFGEWEFATVNGDGSSQAGVLADDLSDAIDATFAAETFAEGNQVAFIRGIWYYSFGDYKLVPETESDFGALNTPVEEEELPGRYALDQNYPNPFNPSTTIAYEVARAGHVTLQVFDMLGRHVATLVDGQVAAGPHRVTFNASHLASGMYLYRLSAGTEVLTQRMMLIK